MYTLPYRSRLRQILEEERPDLVEVCDKYTLCYLPAAWRNGWAGNAPPAVFIGLSCERMDDNVSAFLSDGSLGRRFANWYMRAIYAPRSTPTFPIPNIRQRSWWPPLPSARTGPFMCAPWARIARSSARIAATL